MVKSEKKIVLKAIAKKGTVNAFSLFNTFNSKNPVNGPFDSMDYFDNVVMRYIRHLAAKGYLKRTARGFYKVTKRGQKYIKKNT